MLVGGLMLAAGLLLTVFGRLGLGKLPGDIVVRRGNFTFYFPIVTSIVLSVLLTLIVWLFNHR